MFSIEELNLVMTGATALGQLLLAGSLSFAAIRNGLKGNIRPSVSAMAFYFVGAFALTFLRFVTRIYVFNGGISGDFVNTPWYTSMLWYHALVTWGLYIILSLSYSGQRKPKEEK